MSRPYFVLGTPRSRTAWLSAFLSMPGRPCQHEPSRFLRDRAQLLELLRDSFAAVSDSALTFRWQELDREAPTARIVVVRRPLGDVEASALAAGMAPKMSVLRRLDREIEMLLHRMPVLAVPYACLRDQATCEAVFEYCLGMEPPPRHWLKWERQNVQADIPQTIADVTANLPGLLAVLPELVPA